MDIHWPICAGERLPSNESSIGEDTPQELTTVIITVDTDNLHSCNIKSEAYVRRHWYSVILTVQILTCSFSTKSGRSSLRLISWLPDIPIFISPASLTHERCSHLWSMSTSPNYYIICENKTSLQRKCVISKNMFNVCTPGFNLQLLFVLISVTNSNSLDTNRYILANEVPLRTSVRYR